MQQKPSIENIFEILDKADDKMEQVWVNVEELTTDATAAELVSWQLEIREVVSELQDADIQIEKLLKVVQHGKD